jgi:hypothetical protein
MQYAVCSMWLVYLGPWVSRLHRSSNGFRTWGNARPGIILEPQRLMPSEKKILAVTMDVNEEGAIASLHLCPFNRFSLATYNPNWASSLPFQKDGASTQKSEALSSTTITTISFFTRFDCISSQHGPRKSARGFREWVSAES